MSRILPVPKDVRDLLEDLLGKDVTVGPAEPMRSADLPATLLSVFVEPNLQLGVVVGMDFTLSAFAGAAIGLIPPGGAEACIEDKQLSPMIAENAAEVCNVLGSLFNKEGWTHLKLHQTFLPGDRPPADAANHLLALGRRLDLTVEVAGYGKGKLSIALAA